MMLRKRKLPSPPNENSDEDENVDVSIESGDDENENEINPFLLEPVLHVMLGLMSVSEIKNFRLVSSPLEDVSLEYLAVIKKLKTIKIKSRAQLKVYMKCVENNARIIHLFNKINLDLNFLVPLHHFDHVKSVMINASLDKYQQQFQNMSNILTRTSTNLIKFQINVHNTEIQLLEFNQVFFEPGLKLSKLEDFSIGFDHKNLTNIHCVNLIRTYLDYFLSANYTRSISSISLVPAVFETSLEILNEILQNIQSISFIDFSFLKSSLANSGFLIDNRLKLSKLTLNVEDFEVLVQTILQNQAVTLEELDLTLKHKDNAKITFPAMHNLKVLKLSCSNEDFYEGNWLNKMNLNETTPKLFELQLFNMILLEEMFERDVFNIKTFHFKSFTNRFDFMIVHDMNFTILNELKLTFPNISTNVSNDVSRSMRILNNLRALKLQLSDKQFNKFKFENIRTFDLNQISISRMESEIEKAVIKNKFASLEHFSLDKFKLKGFKIEMSEKKLKKLCPVVEIV